MLKEILHQLKEVPEYFIALKAGLAVVSMGLPLYAGLRYFLYRRRLTLTWLGTLNFFSAFILFGGLAFLLASPLAHYLHSAVIMGYLFVTCIATALGVVSLIDLFLLEHYLSHVKKVYISPPMRMVIKLVIFCLALLLIMRFVLHFNPLTLIAIPTIVTAGLALAMQDTLKAFIAGIQLGRMFRLGEWISFQKLEGRVIDINWARTVLDTVDGQRVYIPNTQLQTGIFTKFTGGSPANQVALKVSVSHEVAPARVKESLLQCLEGVPGVVRVPAPQALWMEYADSGMIYGLLYAVEDYNQRTQIQDALVTRVWEAFRREGIAVSYPIRTIHLERHRVTHS
jgi:small-conductance mechanosensitive channel